MYTKLENPLHTTHKIINKFIHKYSEQEDFIEEHEATLAVRSRVGATIVQPLGCTTLHAWQPHHRSQPLSMEGSRSFSKDKFPRALNVPTSISMEGPRRITDETSARIRIPEIPRTFPLASAWKVPDISQTKFQQKISDYSIQILSRDNYP